MSARPIVLTCGEPAGIAPEITAKAWGALHSDAAACFCFLGDAHDIAARAEVAGIQIPITVIASPSEAPEVFGHSLPVLHMPLREPSRAAKINTTNSNVVIDVISAAANMCLRGEACAMVTNPIQKDALYAVGFKHQGHTDFLASLVRAQGLAAQDVMMLVAADLRAVPITVHIPLKDVPGALSSEMIVAQGRVTTAALRDKFGIAKPRIAVTGLNPHAGENGAMGHEEQAVIAPAIAALRKLGINAFGPLSADTAFHPDARATYDVILCMYHDQALIPVKTLDFHGGVNVTLGLPFIRTSPDHGTALGLAGSGTARPDSLIAAITLAAHMAAR